jgi:hypothetical protein
MIVIKFILLLISVFTGYFLGYLFTEKYQISKYKVFDFKAFKCRKCLSTHIAWVTSTIFSLMFADWVMLFFGLVFAAALFLGLKIDEKEKTVSVSDFE